ncbi:hypothetical protein ACOSQ3_005266 [Xanthoceras sorbifolium]
MLRKVVMGRRLLILNPIRKDDAAGRPSPASSPLMNKNINKEAGEAKVIVGDSLHMSGQYEKVLKPTDTLNMSENNARKKVFEEFFKKPDERQVLSVVIPLPTDKASYGAAPSNCVTIGFLKSEISCESGLSSGASLGSSVAEGGDVSSSRGRR